MKKATLFLILFLSLQISIAEGKQFGFQGLTGVGSYPAQANLALDGWPVLGDGGPPVIPALSNNDFAMGGDSGFVYFYEYDTSSSAAENEPFVINPNDNAGNGRWLLLEIFGPVLISGTPVANDIPRFTNSSTVEPLNYTEFKAATDLEAGTDFYSKTAEDTWRNSVSQTEMGYLDGLTSDLQGQLDLKSPLASPTFTGTVTIPSPFTLGATSVTPTGAQFNYLGDVTGLIQAQLDARCLESILGTSIGGGIILDGAVLKTDTDLQTLAASTAWRVFYSDGSSVITELALGTSGQYLKANGAGSAPTWDTPSGSDRFMTKLDLTADTSISEAQILANRYISNQGDAGEADLTLPALSYAIQVIFSVEEVQNIEINPPAGEIFDLDGTALDADDCVDSDSTVGSKISATRLQIADASWRWSLDTIRGVWIDTGASD